MACEPLPQPERAPPEGTKLSGEQLIHRIAQQDKIGTEGKLTDHVSHLHRAIQALLSKPEPNDSGRNAGRSVWDHWYHSYEMSVKGAMRGVSTLAVCPGLILAVLCVSRPSRVSRCSPPPSPDFSVSEPQVSIVRWVSTDATKRSRTRGSHVQQILSLGSGVVQRHSPYSQDDRFPGVVLGGLSAPGSGHIGTIRGASGASRECRRAEPWSDSGYAACARWR